MKNSSYVSTYEDGTESSETSAYKIQTPGITQKQAQNMSWVSDIFNSHLLHLAVKCTTKPYRAVNTFLLYYGDKKSYFCLGK